MARRNPVLWQLKLCSEVYVVWNAASETRRVEPQVRSHHVSEENIESLRAPLSPERFIHSLLFFCGSGKILLVSQPPNCQEIGVYVCGRDCCCRIPSEIQFEIKQSRRSWNRILLYVSLALMFGLDKIAEWLFHAVITTGSCMCGLRSLCKRVCVFAMYFIKYPIFHTQHDEDLIGFKETPEKKNTHK